MATYVFEITTSDTGMANKVAGTTKWETARKIANYFNGLACGSNKASVSGYNTASTKASATVTLATVLQNDVLTIAGRAFTGKDSPSGTQQFLTGSTDDASRDSLISKINSDATASTYVVASIGGVKATGTQTLSSVVATNACGVQGVTFTCVAASATPTNVQFCVGADDTATAANLVSTLNSHPTVSALMTATSSGAVVTLEAKVAGEAGNAYTLTSGTNITRSGANLASGTAAVLLTAIDYGTMGNAISLATSGATIALSSANLAGGTAQLVTYSYGQ